MKSWFSVPKHLFTLLVIASVLAVAAGTYLGFALGSAMPGMSRILPFLGIVTWADAWIEFLALCLRLRRGDSAFTASTGRTLHRIGWCMVALAAIAVLSAVIGGSRADVTWLLVEYLLLPGVFLAVYVVSKILRGLLQHAMALEEEQEGVV